jgi:hypothetical protein
VGGNPRLFYLLGNMDEEKKPVEAFIEQQAETK